MSEIRLTSDQWVDITTAAGKNVGDSYALQNTSTGAVILHDADTIPSNSVNNGAVIFPPTEHHTYSSVSVFDVFASKKRIFGKLVDADRPAILAIKTLVSKAITRFIYNFDGVDDRISLQYRAINPDGDIDIEFTTGDTLPVVGTSWTIISQNVTATSANREFGLYTNNSNALQLMVGGSFSANMDQPLEINSKYRVTLFGTELKYYKNDNLILTTTFNRGAAREPSAVTNIAARNTAVSSWGSYYRGQLYNIKINGTTYPIQERSQTIQLPSPSGLGAELITQTVLENPVSKGTQWAYLGNGRWQYVGDGSFNSIRFLPSVGHPSVGMIEFEVESISGTMRCTSGFSPSSSVGTVFSSVGFKRAYYTAFSLDTQLAFCRNNAGVAASCIIKNISFKPLFTLANNTNLVVNGDFASSAGWTTTTETSISSGKLNFAATTATRNVTREMSIQNNKDYLLTYTVDSISSGEVRVIVYAPDRHYISPNRTVAGTYSEVVRFNNGVGSFVNTILVQAGHVSATTAQIDNISLVEINTLCNPAVMVNTTSDRWVEIPDTIVTPKLMAFNSQSNSQYLTTI